MTKKLYLLDALALIYRAHFAFIKNPRVSSNGMNTSAIFGFVNALLDILQKESPTHIVVAFDTIAPTDRTVVFSEYKANREAMPEDIQIAIPYIKKILEAMNIAVLESDGYEADDVVGTMTLEAEKLGFDCYCVSPDKDFAQLVTEKTFLYRHGRMGKENEIWDLEKVKEKWEIERAEQVIDILGLWGDAVDNIPGIPGIGEKKAKQLIKEYDNMENIFAHADNIKGKMGENIREFQEQGLISKQLATIHRDVPLEWTEDMLELKDFDKDKLKSIFQELEFRMFAKRMLGEELNPVSNVAMGDQLPLFEIEDNDSEQKEIEANILSLDKSKQVYTLISTKNEYKRIVNQILEAKQVCIDTETDGLDVINSRIIGISLSFISHTAYYIPYPQGVEEQKWFVDLSKQYLENESVEKIGQNLKFDISMFANMGIYVVGKLSDTMLAHYLLEPEGKHGMDSMALKYLNYKPISITSLIGSKKESQISMADIPVESIIDYAAEDADITLQLDQYFNPKIKEQKYQPLYEIECKLIYVLSQMEREGVKVDSGFLKNYSSLLKEELIESEKAIYKSVGEEFNISSPKQLGIILFDKLKLSDNPTKTKTGQYKTDESVLKYLSLKHIIAKEILNYRELQKLRSTYVEALPNMINPTTGKVHTSFNQALTSTGRLSSNNPNLQNIPIKTARGREVRKAFIATSLDNTLLSADYSQIEIRIMAEVSADENMMNAFLNGEDIHTDTAAKIYDVPLHEITKEQRRNAKAINFGIIYGQTAFGLSRGLNISRTEAKDIIDSYFQKFKGVKKYIERVKEKAKQQGYVSTLMGRRRYLRDINSNNNTLRGFAERNAINMPIQGTAADMIKIAMNDIYYQFRKYNFQSKMILQVHDELVFDVKKNELQSVKEVVSECMKSALDLKVPILVEMGEGENWLEAH